MKAISAQLRTYSTTPKVGPHALAESVTVKASIVAVKWWMAENNINS